MHNHCRIVLGCIQGKGRQLREMLEPFLPYSLIAITHIVPKLMDIPAGCVDNHCVITHIQKECTIGSATLAIGSVDILICKGSH
jgi:hypothetical protein